jgi:hypothetical protein
VENWRGSRAWAVWQREQEAEGFDFDRASYTPPPIPDDENFAAAPRIAAAINGTQDLLKLPPAWQGAGMGNWREGRATDLEAYRAAFPKGDLKGGLEVCRAGLDDIEKAAQRPHCRLAFDYAHFPDSGFPSLLGFRAAARVLQVRALLALQEGRTDAAFQDVTTLLRMANHFGTQPLLLSQLLHLALAGIAMQPLWEGLETHAWTEAQLSSLQPLLARVDSLDALNHAWRFETAGMTAHTVQLAEKTPWFWASVPDFSSYLEGTVPPSRTTRLVRRLAIPRGWILQGSVRSLRAFKETIFDPLDMSKHQIDPRRQDAALKAHSKPGHGPYSIFAVDMGPAMAAQNIRAARIQSSFAQANIACDLERYHRAKKCYPERLTDLGVAVPTDVIGGQPLHYRRTQEGGYVLYSVGWNGTDDGGKVGQGEDAIRDGDWVWRISGGHGPQAKKP